MNILTFFFQAEDGIRDGHVTGVQTCALPIYLLKEQGFTEEIVPSYFSVKEAVFPFNKFPGIDPILGPEMKSTGEVMGVGDTFAEAYAKAQLGAGDVIPERGTVFISVRDVDKSEVAEVARDLIELGFKVVATRGTARILSEAGLEVTVVNKVQEGRPHIVDMIKSKQIHLILNTTEGKQAVADSSTIRSSAEAHAVYYTTTMAGGRAVVMALRFGNEINVRSLQSLHRRIHAQ